ncbi:MAG: ABC transporter permease [Robiginitomaculum sp.]|nr:MAG: ABC transporter permease [Robiginitomaculum sp.]
MIIVAAATAAYTWLLKIIVDSMGANALGNSISESSDALAKTRHFVRLIVPAVIGLTFVSGLSLFTASILSNKVALNVVGDLQKSMFGQLQRMDYAKLRTKPVGNYVAHFTNDVNVVAAGLLRSMNNLVRDLLTLIFLIGAMFYHNWQLSLIILLVYPLAFWPIIQISKRIRGTSTDAQNQMGTINILLNESLSGARMVRAYGLEPYEEKRLGSAFTERVRLYLKLVTNQARVDPILEVLTGIAIAGVLAFGVYQMADGSASAGQLVAVLTALGLAAPKARALGTLNNVVQEGLSALKRIFSILDTDIDIIEKNNAPALAVTNAHIKINNVSFSYEDGTQALDAISFEAKSGQTIALVGPSGGGKSTVINLIPRLYDVSAGSITINGQDVRDVTLKSLRGNIALVSQDIILFDDTIAANIGFGDQSASQSDIEAAANAAAAHDFIMDMPNGYQTRIGEDGGKLSGGQRQRISLARAMLRDAPILLLDEATSALDAESESKVQMALDTLSKGRTVFVIAHRLSTVRKADKIIVLDKGKIVETGTHESLMKAKGLYAKLRALQFK